MRSALLCFCLLFEAHVNFSQNLRQTPFERSGGQETAAYAEGIDYYRYLDSLSEEGTLLIEGTTDSGFPLHLFLISKAQSSVKQIFSRPFVLIMNGIHPGESDGIDASMLLARELLKNPKLNTLLNQVDVGIIPFYNVGGALNRNCCTRANQNGPNMYGFRGNARNFDLNRDFIKTDTRNTQAFQALFKKYKPSLFLDTHVSNGADYPYVLTYIESQPDKLGSQLGPYQAEVITPFITRGLEREGVLHNPYVDFDVVPEKGITAFFDAARYSTGYAALFNCPGYMIETHMLKPYSVRVYAIIAFLKEALRFVYETGKELNQKILDQQQEDVKELKRPVDWKLDLSTKDSILFKGYTSKYKLSKVSGLQQLYYDRTDPYEKYVPFLRKYSPTQWVSRPQAYIIPKAYQEIAEKLSISGVRMDTIKNDTMLIVEQYEILSYETGRRPYEGHYVHDQTKVSTLLRQKKLSKGDFLISTYQESYRFIMECLEPISKDSYFNWNYFDAILQPKEGFSDYVFEPVAADILESDKDLKQEFEKKKASDSIFATQHQAQLQFIYRRSKYAEPDYMKYPIYRLLSPAKLNDK